MHDLGKQPANLIPETDTSPPVPQQKSLHAPRREHGGDCAHRGALVKEMAHFHYGANSGVKSPADALDTKSVTARARQALTQAVEELAKQGDVPDDHPFLVTLQDRFDLKKWRRVFVYECDQFGVGCSNDSIPGQAIPQEGTNKKIAASMAYCGACPLYHAAGDSSKPLEPPRGPGTGRDFLFPEKAKQRAKRERKTIEQRGPELWGELHRWALTDGSDIAAWLARFEARIPCGECRDGFRQFVADDPIPAEAADLFAWTVRLHNFTNRKLDKPEISEEEARRVWGTKAQQTV